VSIETIHILLVGSSQADTTIIREALESWHTPVILRTTQNLAEARSLLSQYSPHLTITDLILNDGNGLDLLCSREDDPAPPLVIMNNQSVEQNALESIKAGAISYVSKSAEALAAIPRIVETALHEWKEINQLELRQENLRQSEESLRAFFDSAASSMAIIDLDGRLLRINPNFSRFFGYKEAEALEKTIYDITYPDDRENMIHLYNEIKKGSRQVIDYEKRYLRKDGSVVWGHATVAGIYSPDGTLKHFAGSVQDITQNKQIQSQSREAQQMLQLVLDHIPQHVFWKDRASVYLGCNTNFAEVAGVQSPQEIVGKTDYDLAWKREEADFFRECDQRVMETGTPELHIIEPQQQADGKAAWLDTNKIPLHNSEGQVTGILGTFEDITKRKLVEEELTRYRHQLEELVKEQTDTLEKTQAELLQRERLATLGKVTATVSHELRNPLATIQSSLFSIEENLERNEPLQLFRSLQLAERSIQRCVKIIEELNSYARVKPLEVSQTDVDEWLKDLLKELDFPAEISFKLDLSIGGKVTLDQEKLRQVIVNLVNNSVHALQESASVKKHLQISSRLLDDKYELCFNDNGTGMSEETKEKLFEPLFSTKGFGVGLGMVIVKNIVEQHHGEIFIESIEKEGTTVTLRLPVRVQSV